MTGFGFKDLSAQNWTEPDPIMAMFGTIKADGTMSSLTGLDWTERFLEPRLEDYVPEELSKLFEVAKGTAVYGFFFYPLYTVCMGQVYRILDAATVWRCQQLHASKLRTFQSRIRWLIERGCIAKKDAVRWNALRELRNYTSHPSNNIILTPGDAWHALHMAASEINRLFAPQGIQICADQP